jgi:phosphate transport system substrate-binding protein
LITIPQPNPQTTGKATQTLRFCGSETIAANLIPALVREFLLSNGYGSILPVEIKNGTGMSASKDGNSVNIEITSFGTTNGLRALSQGQCDIAMASREAEQSEEEELKEGAAREGLDGYRKEIVAKDGISVVVNRANLIDSLTFSMLAKIFSGKITDWKEVNKWQSGKIHLMILNKDSGTRGEFEARVLRPNKQTYAKSPYLEDKSNIKIANAVSETATAIGFVAFPYVGNSKVLKLSERGDVQPLHPDIQSIRERSYVLSRELLLYTLGTQGGVSFAQRFVDFARDDDGQAVVERVGFVPFRAPIGSKNSRLSLGGVEDNYARAIKGASLQVMTVFFPTGVNTIGATSLSELQSHLPFLRTFIRERGRIMLLGFTDDVGNESDNLRLSVQRAQSVENALRSDRELHEALSKLDIDRTNPLLRSEGFGKLRPIASNDSATDRARNRRVEVWLK